MNTLTRTRLARALVSLALSAVPLATGAQGPEAPARFGYHGWDWGWGHMLFGGLMMLLFWGGLILLIVLAVRWLGRGSEGGPPPSPREKTPMEILEERFARGEIDKEEFEERRRMLSK